MSSLFGGNPLATPVGQKIEQATDGNSPSENWGLNMEICDIINETDEGPKDAIKALRKRLTTYGKNYTIVMYTLTVLETCVKNCGKRFYIQVATKDFLQELIKIIGPKNDPPQVVQEKVLSLIQTWADAFRGAPDLKEVEKVYRDLKTKGIEFPMTDLDSLAPIHTPARTGPELEPPVSSSPQRTPAARAVQYMVPDPSQAPAYRGIAPHSVDQGVVHAQPMQYTGPVIPTADQLAKLRSELDIVQGNCRVFSEMLTEMVPGQEEPADLELLQELNRTCRQMQQRLVELLDRMGNEEVTGELLRINDDLNNVFLRYDRFERYRVGQTPPAPSSVPVPASQNEVPSPAIPQPEPAANLIDWEDEPANNTNGVTQQLSGLDVNSPSQTNQTNSTAVPNDDFDMFAQSRQSFDQSRNTTGAAAYQAQKGDQFTGGLGAAVTTKSQPPAYGNNLLEREGEFGEMEKWLSENKTRSDGAPENQDSMTSSEFDRFLAERARAADDLPDLPASNTSQPHSGGRGTARGGRQLQKEENEATLFAL